MSDFGPTLACEKLWECHGIRLAKETVRRLMTEARLWIPRRHRPRGGAPVARRVRFYLPFRQLFSEMPEQEFIALPIAAAADVRARADNRSTQ